MPVAHLAQAGKEAGSGNDEAPLALNRLHDDGRHVLGRHVSKEEAVQLLQAVRGQIAPVHSARSTIGVGEPRVVNLGRRRSEPLAQRLVAAVERDAEQRAPVEAVVESHHRLPTRVAAGELDRVLDRLRAAVEEDGLLRPRAGDEIDQPPADLHVPLVRRDVEARVGEPARLLPERLHHLRVAVADVEGADAGGEVHVGLAVHVPQRGVAGAVDDELRVGRAAAGDDGLPFLPQRRAAPRLGFRRLRRHRRLPREGDVTAAAGWSQRRLTSPRG